MVYVSALARPHAERIMVDGKLTGQIESMTIGEEQIYNEDTGFYARADNLNVIHTKAESATSSKIWATYEMDSFGDPQNAMPQASSVGPSTLSSIAPFKANENMGVREQARVHEWSRNIDAHADPTQPASHPAVSEPGVEEPLSRRVVAGLDSSEEENEAPLAEETTRRVVAQDSDDESDDVPPPRDRVQRPPQSPQIQPESSVVQDATSRRLTRANRYQNDTPTLRTVPLPQAGTDLISAGTFFADVPRDQDAQGEARFRSEQQASQKIPDPHFKQEEGRAQKTKRHRGLGFNGTAAELQSPQTSETKYNQPSSELSPDTSMQERPSSPTIRGQYKPGADFDTDRYGVNSRGCGNAPDRRYATQTNVLSNSTTHIHPVATWPRAPPSTDMNSSSRRSGEYQSQARGDQLIDYSDDELLRSSMVKPPPGLSPTPKTNRTDEGQHFSLLDGPVDNIQKPSLMSAGVGPPVPLYDETSVSTSVSSGNRTFPYDYNIQTKINKPNIGHMRNDMVSQLQALQTRRKGRKNTDPNSVQGTERIDPEDEVSTRKFHQTMNLRAPNTGNRGKARGNSTNFAMSKRGQQAARSNPRMAVIHAESLKESSWKALAKEVVERMKLPIELAQMFPGEIEFELQIGQLLVESTPKIRDKRALETEKWKSFFDSRNLSVQVFFTNLLTSSGSDADGILEARAEGTKIWNKEKPGRCAVLLDFQCQDSSGSEFTIHLSLDGTHTTSTDVFVLQKIGLHCPGKFWDCCAALKGTSMAHSVPDEAQNSITELIASVHVRAGSQIDLFFRTPSNNSIIVREVVVRKISKHASQLVGEENLQLKIVESKTLYMTGHKRDKRLTRCTEKDQGTMSRDDRVHYEVSIVDRAINAGFEKNKALQTGEVASIDPLQSLNIKRAIPLVRAALRLVDKADWVGAYNIGTIAQRQHIRQMKENEAARSMLPSMVNPSFLRPVNVSTGMSVAGPRSVAETRTVVGSTMGGAGPVSVHGIRSGTSATLVTDMRGNFFKLGIGGARIPVSTQEESSLINDGLVPDDSASQVGASRRQPARRANERPEGFW